MNTSLSILCRQLLVSASQIMHFHQLVRSPCKPCYCHSCHSQQCIDVFIRNIHMTCIHRPWANVPSRLSSDQPAVTPNGGGKGRRAGGDAALAPSDCKRAGDRERKPGTSPSRSRFRLCPTWSPAADAHVICRVAEHLKDGNLRGRTRCGAKCGLQTNGCARAGRTRTSLGEKL